MSNNMAFLWTVTAVVWLGTLAYVYTLLRKQSRLEKSLSELERTLADNHEG